MSLGEKDSPEKSLCQTGEGIISERNVRMGFPGSTQIIKHTQQSVEKSMIWEECEGVILFIYKIGNKGERLSEKQTL